MPYPYDAAPGDPPRIYPLDMPDHYETGDDDLGLARGIGHGLIITGLGLFVAYLVVQWFAP